MVLGRLWVVIGLMWLAAPLGAAAVVKAEVPEVLPGVVTLDAEGLIELVQGLPGLVLIDSRVPADRHQGYIQGSINLPDSQTSCATLADLAADLDTPLLFYCNGVECGRSVHTAEIARGCGYRDIYWFRGGFKEWKRKGYPFLQQ